MPRLLLFYRLLVRPLFSEPVRTALTVFAIALGVAVVLAIDLAGVAATGSFRSSMETLAGDNDLEAVAAGGVPESAVGTLAQLPFNLRISPRMEDYAVLPDTKQTLPLIGLDLIAESNSYNAANSPIRFADLAKGQDAAKALEDLANLDTIYVSSSLGRAVGDRLPLLINDQIKDYTIRGVYSDINGNESAIVMDIAAAQRALQRFGRVDRILIKTPDIPSAEVWQQRLKSALPAGIDIRAQGTATNENRRMLQAFRWNLRLLSYISLIVGAFLIYNTISVSVVRRRAEIGIVRALGASRGLVLGAFIGEAAIFGLVGGLIGLPLGRLMADGAVKLMAITVDALYVSSRPGAIALNPRSVLEALVIGVGVAVASAFAPAREAAQVSPVEAMARGRREYDSSVHKLRDLVVGAILALAAAIASQAPAILGKPVFGYLSAFLLIVAAALAIPAFVDGIVRISSQFLKRLFGVEALLASRSLRGSLRRTSVLVGALSTAIAMTTSVGIMVGSFRQTVISWMGDQLPADLYLRPASNPAADRHPTISLELANTIATLPGVEAVDRLRTYEISYDGLPATLASADLRILRQYKKSAFFSGRSTEQVLADLKNADAVVVSEPFTYKHHVKTGDTLRLSLGSTQPSFRIVDVYYDYSSERGNIIMDRDTMLKYLPDETPSNIAVYVTPGTAVDTVRNEIIQAAANHRILIFSNANLRGEAIRIFDRTFAITYALEAVAILVAVMGVAGALLALVIDRRRELGLLRFLGSSKNQIRKLIVVEAGLLGLLANVAGVILGFAMSLVLIFVINKQSFGWTIRFHWPVAITLGALTGVYVATVLSSLYPAQIAVRLNPLEVVHDE
ncbi:MAG TPA: FtsX-like permease family protein [Candidatus Dormibacteraeota bacterium]|nr:FtsX-like permease family protein [Candidatus Dormibacteraeota bacterium]